MGRLYGCRRDITHSWKELTGGSGTGTGPGLIIGHGRALDILPEQIRGIEPDLVVIGSHTRSTMMHVFLGSVAQTLPDLLPLDVLVVRS